MGRDVVFVFVLALLAIWYNPVCSETADLEVSGKEQDSSLIFKTGFLRLCTYLTDVS